MCFLKKGSHLKSFTVDVLVGPVLNVIKLFYFVSDEEAKQVGLFVLGKAFQLGLIFAGKARCQS